MEGLETYAISLQTREVFIQNLRAFIGICGVYILDGCLSDTRRVEGEEADSRSIAASLL